VIAEVAKGGLDPHHSDPRNPPPTIMYLFRYTMVSIAGPLYNFNVRACFVLTMKCGRRSVAICDLGDPAILIKIYPSANSRILLAMFRDGANFGAWEI
jgi:hypothetical protein